MVTQSAMAFAQVLGAFSLIVAQFQSLSTFAAVIRRLGSLWEAMDGADEGGPWTRATVSATRASQN